MDAFARFTIASYVANLTAAPATLRGNSPCQYRSRRSHRRGTDRDAVRESSLDYLMRQEGGAWKVVDVLAEGVISLVAA